jgi:hypothetical protein
LSLSRQKKEGREASTNQQTADGRKKMMKGLQEASMLVRKLLRLLVPYNEQRMFLILVMNVPLTSRRRAKREKKDVQVQEVRA